MWAQFLFLSHSRNLFDKVGNILFPFVTTTLKKKDGMVISYMAMYIITTSSLDAYKSLYQPTTYQVKDAMKVL